MDRILQAIYDEYAYLTSEKTVDAFKAALRPDIQALKRLHFSFTNPVFALCILVVLLVLSKGWVYKKAFSYCVLVSSILCLTSGLEAYFAFPIEGSGVSYMDLVRGGAFALILVITVYYAFIRNE